MITKEFTHPRQNDEIASISGRYAFTKEDTLDLDGRTLLYLTGYAVTDSACCGVAAVVFSLVPGFIVAWHSGKSADGRDISEVEPVADEARKAEIASLLKEREMSTQVNFL